MAEHNLSANADIRPSGYRFERMRQDRLYVPLVKSPRVFSFITWVDIASGAGLVAFMIGAYVATHGVRHLLHWVLG